VLAAAGVRPSRAPRPGRCGFCGGPPWIAFRRIDAAGEGADGAARHLGCALCGGDWLFVRGRCPGCAEEDPRQLPVFSADAHPNVRLEACESCRGYLKSIDLTLDARPIPEVDDLLSLSLDLWAAEQGFTRLAPGLAGI
jgi:FdhE protein